MSPMVTIAQGEPITYRDGWKEKISELPLVKFEFEMHCNKMIDFKSMLMVDISSILLLLVHSLFSKYLQSIYTSF